MVCRVKFELINVSKIKNGKPILRNINLQFLSGSKYTILGPSGSGKTTLLRLLNRMEEPSSGEILFDGENIKNIPVTKLRKKVGMVFQIPVVFEGTVEDNLLVPYSIKGIPPDKEEIKKALTLSGLKESFLSQRAMDLSVGEKQRLNLARALLNNPEVLLLDEPTSALDYETALTLLNSVNELNRVLGLTIIMVTHQVEHMRILNGSAIYIENGTVLDKKTTQSRALI